MKKYFSYFLASAVSFWLIYWQLAQVSAAEVAALPLWQAVLFLTFSAVALGASTLPAAVAILEILESRGQQ